MFQKFFQKRNPFENWQIGDRIDLILDTPADIIIIKSYQLESFDPVGQKNLVLDSGRLGHRSKLYSIKYGRKKHYQKLYLIATGELSMPAYSYKLELVNRRVPYEPLPKDMYAGSQARQISQKEQKLCRLFQLQEKLNQKLVQKLDGSEDQIQLQIEALEQSLENLK